MKQKAKKLFQQIYLTGNNFNRNGLWESAASCSFGFLLSFIPVLMIIVSICAGILRVNEKTLQFVLSLAARFRHIYDIEPFLQNFMKIRGVTWMEIVLAVWIVWMARRFFLSIAQGMFRIFRSVARPAPFVVQFMTFVAELLLVIALIVIVMTSFLLKELFSNASLEFLYDIFPDFYSNSSNILAETLFYFVIFAFCTAIYRYESRSKPKLRLCLACSIACTLSFFVVNIFYNLFYDMSRVNLVYGTISAVIFLMMKVYTFFLLFLFFAEFVYVSQRYETLLFGELYFLPETEEAGFWAGLKRSLFIQPVSVASFENKIHYKAGETIFSVNDKADAVYYIVKGTVEESMHGKIVAREKGSFIGERSTLITKYRVYTAVARTDVELICIPQDKYLDFLTNNEAAQSKFIRKITR
ncbi:MAG: YihY/virulence factor BrkB family protein [Treponema sp.]|nr:YihY/virulence factor BrkB family protein [Treponema sp.]